MGPIRITVVAGIACAAACFAQSPGSALIFTNTFGGSGTDTVTAVAAVPSGNIAGNIIAAGSTSSYDFPVTNGSANTGTQFAASADSAASWHALANLPNDTPLSLVADTSTPPVWYATAINNVYKSADGGATWQPIGPSGLAGCANYPASCGITALVVNPAQPSTIYARGGAGILETTDAGATWSFVNAPPSVNPPGYLALDPFHPTHLFTKIEQNDYRSLDGGQTWMQFTPPLLHPGNNCGSALSPVAFDAVTPNLVYMVDHCDLFVSTDGGIYWNPITAPFTISYGVVAHPTQAAAFYVTTFQGLYATTDGGSTWNLLLANEQGNPPHVVAIDPRQPSVIMTDSALSQNGGATWINTPLGRSALSVVFDPQTAGRAVAATQGAPTAFLTETDGTGAILAATYFGGQGTTKISAIAADGAGNVYVAGSSTSPDFPATPTPGVTAFAAKFDANLNLLYATFLPGAGTAVSIAVDPAGSAVVAGAYANTSPTSCYAAKLAPDGSHTLFFTPFGGTGGEYCTAVATDAAGNTIVVGTTYSKNFPVNGKPPSTTIHGYTDVFLAKLDPSGNLILSGYLGGGDQDSASAVAADASGAIYITGTTASADFPVTPGAYQTALSSNCPYPSSAVATGFIGTIYEYNTNDAFVTKLDPSGAPIFSTYLGGGCNDQATAIALDPNNNVWLLGSTNSDPFPQVEPFQSGPAYAAYRPFVTVMQADGGSLALSSYIDSAVAIAVDATGAAYIGGYSAPHASLSKVQVQPPAAVSITSLGNAFTLRSGPVSPGQITLIAAAGIALAQPVSLGLMPSGALPTTLAGAQVFFDGEAAPLISVDNGAVTAVAPYDLAGKTQTSVQVVFQGSASAPMLADVHSDVGYLGVNGSATGQAYALNPDGTQNSPANPAPVGSMITVFITGVGVTDPACPQGGTAAVASPVTVRGLSGLTSVPGAVCGLFEFPLAAPTYPTTFTLADSQVTVTVH